MMQTRRKKEKKRVKVPSILQLEAVECGAASLAMILSFYGKQVPLEQLRIEMGVSRDGVKANNILKVARNYGLVAKGFRKEPSQLKQMVVPMIIHWNFNHFLVLEGFHKDQVFLNDPAKGRRTVSFEEFDQAFTGVVLTFELTPAFETGGEKPSLVDSFIKRLHGYGDALWYVLLMGFMFSLTGMVIPMFSKIFVDDILIQQTSDWLIPLVIGMLFTFVLRVSLLAVKNHVQLKFENQHALQSASHFFGHLLKMPIDFFYQRYIGEIGNRVRYHLDVSHFFANRLASLSIDILMIVLYMVIMMQYSVILTIIGIVTAVFNMMLSVMIMQKQETLNMKLIQDEGKLSGVSMTGLLMIETIKSGGYEHDFFSRWAGFQTKYLNNAQKLGAKNQVLLALPGLLESLTMVLILVIGGYLVMAGETTVGSLVAFQSLMGSFLLPVKNIVFALPELQHIKGKLNQLDDVVNYPIDPAFIKVEETPVHEWKKPVKLMGEVEMNNISFGFSRLAPPLIEDFHLTLLPGELVAIVGGSGSGKSTIAKLLTGLYAPWSGDIMLDKVPKEQWPKWIITNSLSMVNQDIHLFEGTIRENITMWDQTIREEDMIKAAKIACIHDDIISLRDGYDHLIQEGGRNFSGGQRQRLEIARALVNNPSILVLDEATSALDSIVEKEILQGIRALGCSCLIIAHRLSTIRNCDDIIVLNQGKIVQRGRHHELIAEEGFYKQLIEAD